MSPLPHRALGAAVLLALGLSASARAQTLPQVIHPDGPPPAAAAQRGAGGTYAVDAEVNGARLSMMFDTGASFVAIRAEDAAAAGIDLQALRYTLTARTANGETPVAPVLLRTLTVGQITRHDVPAIVARPGVLSSNLLGQSFMTRLAGYRFEGNRIILQDR